MFDFIRNSKKRQPTRPINYDFDEVDRERAASIRRQRADVKRMRARVEQLRLQRELNDEIDRLKELEENENGNDDDDEVNNESDIDQFIRLINGLQGSSSVPGQASQEQIAVNGDDQSLQSYQPQANFNPANFDLGKLVKWVNTAPDVAVKGAAKIYFPAEIPRDDARRALMKLVDAI